MADKEKKSTMKRFMTNDQADYYSGITSIRINGKNAYELKGKFLDDLHNNAFSGTNGEDVVEHIEYFLRIVDPIDLPNNIRTIGFMGGIKMCHGCMKNHGQRMEYERNQHQLNIVVSPLIIKMDVQSGLPIAGEKMDIVMEETCLEPT
ncbi:hypothetical protein Tco_0970245 [Tanacetum coccineum]